MSMAYEQRMEEVVVLDLAPSLEGLLLKLWKLGLSR